MNAPLRHPVAVLKERPFDGRLRRLKVDWNRAPSIAEILDAQEDLPRGFHERCVARVVDQVVPREMWRHVRPKPCAVRDGKVIDVVVIFSLPLGGPGAGGARGGGGAGGAKKNPVTTVASIAVLLAGTIVSAGTLGPVLGPAFAAGTIGAHLAGAAISLGGALAIAALSPPPSLRSNQGVISSDAGTDAAASLSGNVLSKGNPVPRVIGTMRVYPPVISPELIEIVGDQTVAECVFGLAGPHQLTDLMVGNATAASFTSLQTEIQEGLPNSPVLSLVSRQSYTDPTATQALTQHVVDNSTAGAGQFLLDQTNPTNSVPQWCGVTSRIAPDEIWLHLNFPAGLSKNSSTAVTVPVRLRMRQSGTANWINLPEVHVVRISQASFQVAIKLMFEAAQPLNEALANQAGGGPVRCYASVPTQNEAPTGTGGWTADSYFYNGTGDTYMDYRNVGNVGTTGVINTNLFLDRAEFYLSGAKFPQSGNWDVQIIRGQAFIENNFTSNATYVYGGGSTVADFFGWITSSGIFETLDDQRQYAQAIELIRFSSIWNEPPVPDPSQFAVIAAKVTNVSVGQLSVLASGYVKDWDGAGWNTVTTTSNPAPHLYDVLTGTLGGSPLPPSVVDSAGLVAFRTLCAANGYTCNAVVEGKTYVDVATMIAATGFAKLRRSELWGIAVDQNTTGSAPIQVFTPRNMAAFTVSKPLARLPTGIRASFQDASKNYLPNEIIIFADPNNPDSSRLEQIAYDGLVNATDNEAVPGTGVTERATFDLLAAQLRMTFYKGKADGESIVCQGLDLVAVQNDILDSYAGAAFIQSVQRSGGNIVGLTLDGTVRVNTQPGIFSTPHLFTVPHVFDLGGKTGLCIRLKGGNGVTISSQVTAIENGDANAVSFATPFADPGVDGAGNLLIDAGCLVTSGRLGSEYRRLKVFSITPSSDMTADLTFVDEAPGLWPPVLILGANTNVELGAGVGEVVGL